jgi:hypothetical protein
VERTTLAKLVPGFELYNCLFFNVLQIPQCIAASNSASSLKLMDDL